MNRNGLPRGDRGQALVESAISIVLLLTMVFAVIAGGFM